MSKRTRMLFIPLFLTIFVITTTLSFAYSRDVVVRIPRIMLKQSFYNPAVIHFKITIYDSGRYITHKETSQLRIKRYAYLFGPYIKVKMPQDWTPVNMSVKIEVLERGHLYNSVHSSVQRNIIKGATIKDKLDTTKIYMEYIIEAKW